MAAGEGRRMRPLTYEIPKPMVPVNGTRMIDTVIRGLHENGISEIYVVVGYLKDQFRCLEQEYSGLQLIDNPWYDTCNNISSLYAAREHLEDCMILDGDSDRRVAHAGGGRYCHFLFPHRRCPGMAALFDQQMDRTGRQKTEKISGRGI